MLTLKNDDFSMHSKDIYPAELTIKQILTMNI